MRRKVALGAAAVALIGTLAVGGTLAWFTDTETATNVVTTGNVDISILEKGDGQDEYEVEDDAGLELAGPYVPGAEIGKAVKIKNTGANSAYIRVLVEFENLPGEEEPELNFDTTDWIKEGSYYYYKTSVEKDAETTDLFTTVTIPAAWDNSATDKSDINIKLTAEAIQSEHNGNSAVEAFAENEIQDYEDGTAAATTASQE